MSTPTEGPVDQVSVCLSNADFCRIVANAMADTVLKHEYRGRIEVTKIETLFCDEEDGWIIECLFIPEDDS